MQVSAAPTEAPVAIRTDLGAIFVSLELSRSKWLVTSVSPGAGEKMSKFNVRAGDIPALLERFGDLQRKAEARTGQTFRIISIQEAGLDGFWIHRVLEREGAESYIVDPASIATSRRRRRAKTDRIDGEGGVICGCIWTPPDCNAFGSPGAGHNCRRISGFLMRPDKPGPRASMDFRALPPQWPLDIGRSRAGPQIRFGKRRG